MEIINNNAIKFNGNRAYKYSRFQMRWFPIKKSVALQLIADGESTEYVEQAECDVVEVSEAEVSIACISEAVFLFIEGKKVEAFNVQQSDPTAAKKSPSEVYAFLNRAAESLKNALAKYQ